MKEHETSEKIAALASTASDCYNAKTRQVFEYKPSKKFVNYFNEVANGFSHNFKYDEKSDKIFFSALTHNCGLIQIYADDTKQMEQDFIKAVDNAL